VIVGTTTVKVFPDSLAWCAGLEVDVDGSPKAYSPPACIDPNGPLDDLRNAGTPGNYYGIVCNDFGIPYVQGPDDPQPGYYVSSSALVDHTKAAQDPLRYVDAEVVPFLAVPPELVRCGARMGSLAMVSYKDRISAAILGDVGPHNKVGEGSYALHRALGVDPQRAKPKHYLVGIDSGVRTVVFFGSVANPAWPRDVKEFSDVAAALFMKWGGADRLMQIPG
jgi:hypothetical protein